MKTISFTLLPDQIGTQGLIWDMGYNAESITNLGVTKMGWVNSGPPWSWVNNQYCNYVPSTTDLNNGQVGSWTQWAGHETSSSGTTQSLSTIQALMSAAGVDILFRGPYGTNLSLDGLASVSDYQSLMPALSAVNMSVDSVCIGSEEYGTWAANLGGFIQNPTTVVTPQVVVQAGSTLPVGTYGLAYSFTNVNTAPNMPPGSGGIGETLISPISTVSLATTGNAFEFPAITLPSGTNGVRYYITQANGSILYMVASNSTGAFTIISAPPTGSEELVYWSSPWQISTTYTVGQYVSSNLNIYVCTTAGTSSSSGNGPSGTNTNISDGTVVWNYVSMIQLNTTAYQDRTAATYAPIANSVAQWLKTNYPTIQLGLVGNGNVTPTLIGNTSLDEWNQAILQGASEYADYIMCDLYPHYEPSTAYETLKSLATIKYMAEYMINCVTQWAVKPLDVWIVEYNTFHDTNALTDQPVHGSATIEALLLWFAYGVKRVYIWSLNGSPPATVNSVAVTGFSLMADTPTGSPLLCELYHSGQALKDLFSMLGTGATVTIYEDLMLTSGIFVAEIVSSSSTSWVVVNNNQDDVILGTTVVPSTQYVILSTEPTLINISNQLVKR